MAVSVNFNGTMYSLPQNRENRGWGLQLSAFLIAVGNHALSKAGGSFALTGEINFGSSYGFITPYLKSATANIASSGIIRLARADVISFRNQANSADLPLGVSSSDRLQFNSVDVVTTSSTDTLTNKSIDGDNNTVTDLALTSLKTVLADANKVIRRDASGVVQSGNTIPNSSALVTTDSTSTLTNKTFDADGTGNSITNIENADIKAGAAIDATKIANGSVSNTEFQYLDGVTSSIQTQLTTNANNISSHTGASSGVHGVTGSVVGTSDTQVITNKTFDDAITVKQVSTPSNPSSGYNKVYAKSDGNLYKLDSSGVEVAVGAGGVGSGEINAIDNPSAVSATTGWAAATNYSISRDTSNSPLAPTISSCFSLSTTTASAESDTSGISYAITMPTSLRNRKLKLEFYANIPASADGVWRVSVYAGSTRLALTTDSSGATTLPGGVNGKFVTYFDTTSASSYSVRFTQTTRTNANTLYATNVIVGPGIQPQGAVVGEWQDYTPTLSAGFGGTSNLAFKWRRVGSEIEIRGFFQIGTVGAGLASFTLPNNLTVENPNTSSTDQRLLYGHYYVLDGTNNILAATQQGVITTSSANRNLLYLAYNTTGTNPEFFDLNNVSSIFTSGESVALFARAAVTEWAGSGTVNLAANNVEFAYNSGTWNTASDTTSFAYGTVGQTINADLSSASAVKRVRFSNIQPTDVFTVLIKLSGASSYIPVGTAVHSSSGYRPVIQLQRINGILYGVGVNPVNSTDVDVIFGQYYNSNAAAYAGAGDGWNGLNGATWIVAKSQPGQAVGFGSATTTSAGLVDTTTQTFAGAKTFQDGITGQTSLTSTTFSANGGGGTSGSVTIQLQKIGQWVTAYIPAFSGTSGTGSDRYSSNTPISATYRPLSTQRFHGGGQPRNNAAQDSNIPLWIINTDGTFAIFRNVGGSTFTNATSCGLEIPATITWYVG